MKYLLIFILSFLIGCGSSSEFGDSNTKVKGGKLIDTINSTDIKNELHKRGIEKEVSKIFSLKAYKILYKTVNINNKEITASGVVIVPVLDIDSNSEIIDTTGFEIVLDLHPTIFLNSQAPTVSIENSGLPYGGEIPYSALNGFITIIPDYLGYGESKKEVEPYLIKNPTRENIVDFTKAAFNFLLENNIAISSNRGLYVSGYSEGGYVALTIPKSLEDAGFNISMIAPMDGPYLLELLGRAIKDAKEIEKPSFIVKLIYSYSKKYGYSLNNIFQNSYAKKIDTIFDKEHSQNDIDRELTTKVKGDSGLFKDSFWDSYSTSNFRKKLIKNSILKIGIDAPIKLIHCIGDNVVPYSIAKREESILKLFDDVELITSDSKESPLNHIKCAPKAYEKAAELFANRRKELIGY